MRECPPGFGLYYPVISRLDYRERGQFLSFRCPLGDRHKNGDRNPSGLAWIGERAELVARCQACHATWHEIADAIGTPRQAWHPKGIIALQQHNRRHHHKAESMSQPTHTYQYIDESGRLVFEKLRYEPKRFAYRRPLTDDLREALRIGEQQQAWVWGLGRGVYRRPSGDRCNFVIAQGGEIRDGDAVLDELKDRPLYRLQELLAADAKLPVIVVEGEKDVDNVRALGLVATCGPNGSTWVPELARHLANRRAFILPDHDEPGAKYATAVLASCIAHGAASVALVAPGGRYRPSAGGDVTSWLREVEGVKKVADAKQLIADVCKAARCYSCQTARSIDRAPPKPELTLPTNHPVFASPAEDYDPYPYEEY